MRRAAIASIASLILLGCGRAPSPLYPALEGSIGMAHRGVLTGAAEMPRTGRGYHFLRDNGRHFAIPRFASAIERAAAQVNEARPGSALVIGDVSTSGGGRILPHFSHRNGRDADLVLYATTLDGTPVLEHGFIHYGPDGLGWDPKTKRYLRFDVAREWILIASLLEDPEANIQWIFIHHTLRAKLLEWALASGASLELFDRAVEVMGEPHPGGLHDDHTHVRTACTDDETFHGCEPFGPARAWLAPKEPRAPAEESDAELVSELMHPLGATTAVRASAAASP